MVSEASVTIPAWIALILGVLLLVMSIEILRWYLDSAEPYPYFGPQLPFIAKKDENRGEDD